MSLGTLALTRSTVMILLATAAVSSAQTRVIRVSAVGPSEARGLGVSPTLELDYGAFRWLELDEADLLRLEAAGTPFELVPGAGDVRVNGFVFDPLRDGEPPLPDGLRGSAGPGPGFQLVQLQGPAQRGWLEALEADGLTILQYYPHQTYLAWGSSTGLGRAAQHGFVRWAGRLHPAYRLEPGLEARQGMIRNVDVLVLDDGALSKTLDHLEDLGLRVLAHHPSQPDGVLVDVIAELPAERLHDVARLDTVLWVGFQSPEPRLDDEMSDQIVAGNHPGGVPVPGYATFLGNLGYDGSGVVWSTVDSGVDLDHGDLASRIVGGVTYPGVTGADSGSGDEGDCTGRGHGTHVTGIYGGDGTGGFTDGAGFLYGLGVAPGVSIHAQNSICGFSWPPTGGWQEHSRQAVLAGASGSNNSWTSGEGIAHGYQATERTHDFMVRDGNFDTPGVAEPAILVFSAGNSGPGSSTLTSPKEAKNLIVTAGSQNYRVAGTIDAMYTNSSRGPTVDGRIGPTITAPGQQIASTRNDEGGSCATSIAGTNTLYAYCTGTSMASPHASGAAILAVDWWRDLASVDPSPALVRALLVNGAVDMGAADIPNTAEGWGRIDLSRSIAPDTPAVYHDQDHHFDLTGEVWRRTMAIATPGEPLRVTLAWSDAPGSVGANPALVNDLDLEVEVGGVTYYGNDFASGWSTTGGSRDALENLENVFLPTTAAGNVEIRVRATAVNGDGIPWVGDATDQDFALVCSNCLESPDFTLEVAPLSRSVCAPADAAFDLEVGALLGFSDPVALAVTGAPVGASTAFSTNPVTPPDVSTLTIASTGLAAAGAYVLTVSGSASTLVHDLVATLTLADQPPGLAVNFSPGNGSGDVPLRPTFEWQSAAQAGTYRLEVAVDDAFSTLFVDESGIAATSFTPVGDLPSSTRLYWRVTPTNACGTGAPSVPFDLVTIALPGDCSPSTITRIELFDGFETGAPGWTHSGTQDKWMLSGARTYSGAWAWYGEGVGAPSDQVLLSPAVALPAGAAGLHLGLWSHQDLESRTGGCYDGGLLELSTDDGVSWTQLTPDPLTDPYDGPISTTSSNPAGGLEAWCGDPQDWTYTHADLGAYAGQTVRLRFRLATDAAVSREGWYLDDLVLRSCWLPDIFTDGFELGDTAAWSTTVE